MSDDSIQDQIRSHLIAFGVVFVLAIIAGATTWLGLAGVEAVLAIATLQVGVVLGFMMHIGRDGRIVGWTVFLCGLFVAAMAGLMLLGLSDEIAGTERSSYATAADEAKAEGDATEVADPGGDAVEAH